MKFTFKVLTENHIAVCIDDEEIAQMMPIKDRTGDIGFTLTTLDDRKLTIETYDKGLFHPQVEVNNITEIDFYPQEKTTTIPATKVRTSI